MKGMRKYSLGCLMLAVAGCANQPLVKTDIGGFQVEYRFQGDKNKELSDRLARATNKFSYDQYYVNAFNGGSVINGQQVHETKWDFADVAAAGHAVDIGLKQMLGGGIGISGAGLIVGLLTPTDDTYIKASISARYKMVTDGTVMLIKLRAPESKSIDNTWLVDDLKQSYEEQKTIIDTVCKGASARKRQVLWPDQAASLDIRCRAIGETYSIVNWMIGPDTVLDKSWHGGWAVTSIVSPEMLKGLSEVERYQGIRASMPTNYYMLWAAPGVNPVSGKEEKVFHVYKDGVEKVFPLPPPPKIS